MTRHIHRWEHIDERRVRLRCVECGVLGYRMGNSYRVCKTMRTWTIERDAEGRPERLIGGEK